MKSFILVVAGLLGLVLLVVLVGGILSVSLRVVAALRATSDRESSVSPVPIAGENRARDPMTKLPTPAATAARRNPE